MKTLRYILLLGIIMFVGINKVQALGGLEPFNGSYCVWKDSTYNYRCDVYAGSLSCKLSCVDSNDKNCAAVVASNSNLSNEFEKDDLLTRDKKFFACPSSVYMKYRTGNLGGLVPNGISLESSGGVLDLKRTSMSLSNSKSKGEDKTQGDKTGPTGEGGFHDSDGDADLDLDKPCQGKVLGVFTTIGWVFWLVKIVVPLVIIIFGIIDISKAVVAGKDGEIGKAAKSLLMRAIAGIVIFFIPSIINMLIGLIGGGDKGVYDGTFKTCTSCMFKPNGSGCTNLGGK